MVALAAHAATDLAQDHKPGSFHRSFRAPAFELLALSGPANASKRPPYSGAASVAVIYPDISEPYRGVFAQITEGIESQYQTKVRVYPLAPNTEPGDLSAKLRRDGIRVVIALGRQGMKAAAAMNSDIAIVVGGVVAAPETENRMISGISLIPDPALLFARLKTLLPGVKRVAVVYDPRQNEWLIKLARDAARMHSLELVAHEARDLALAARQYEAMFPLLDNRADALWLPQDATTVDDKTILPLVLMESWNRNIAVFSSSFSHVKRGALFALYPNNFELGRDLAKSAAAVLTDESIKRGILPLREVHTAINLRTATHVGVDLDARQLRSFDYVFPEP